MNRRDLLKTGISAGDMTALGCSKVPSNRLAAEYDILYETASRIGILTRPGSGLIIEPDYIPKLKITNSDISYW